jgi:hypothetical protein
LEKSTCKKLIGKIYLKEAPWKSYLKEVTWNMLPERSSLLPTFPTLSKTPQQTKPR